MGWAGPQPEHPGWTVCRPSNKTTPAPGGPGINVLVAEDNEINFELVRDLLELDGHRVTWAKDGAEALRLALTEPTDLLLLDLQLPRLPGREVLRQLVSEPSPLPIKILVLSADAMVGTREEVLGAGADAFLAKPFDLGAFRTTLRELLS